MTNIALAIKTYPEIQTNIKDIYIMGGGIKGSLYLNLFLSYVNLIVRFVVLGRGNISPTAEYNFHLDPEAVFIVLNSMILSITILPLNVDESVAISLV